MKFLTDAVTVIQESGVVTTQVRGQGLGGADVAEGTAQARDWRRAGGWPGWGAGGRWLWAAGRAATEQVSGGWPSVGGGGC